MLCKRAVEILNELADRSPRYSKSKIISAEQDKEIVEALEMAIEALQLQIPMKQMEESSIDGRRIKVSGNGGDYPGGGWEYCSWCGQKQDV